MFQLTSVQMESLASKGTVYSGSCETDMMNLYQTTYYPIFRTNCASCHTNGPGVGVFAHSNFQTAYNSFRSMTRTRIERNLVNPSHQPPYTGAQHQAAVDQYTPMWVQAETAAAVCYSGGSGAGAPPGGVVGANSMLTLHKSNAQIVPRATTPNTWTRLEWDLSKEMADVKLNNKMPLTIGIEARVATIGGVRKGYEFRNPTLRLQAGAVGPFRLRELSISINDQKQVDVSTYEFMDVSVNSTTDVNLSPGTAFALAVLPAVNVTDRFALGIGSIVTGSGGVIIGQPGGGGGVPTPTNPLPTKVTFVDLTSSDARLGVFKNSCFSCHSGAGAKGGLDLTSATKAKAAASSILSRMNNSGNPMPPSGLLTQDPRDIVRIWVEGGAL